MLEKWTPAIAAAAVALMPVGCRSEVELPAVRGQTPAEQLDARIARRQSDDALANHASALKQALVAPSEPDFSGRWKLVSSASPGADAPETMTVVQTIQRTNVYGKPMTPFFKDLLVTRDFAAGARTERHMIGGVGGTIAGVGPGGTSVGTNTRHRVAWDHRTLVIENGRYRGPESQTGDWDERREEWSFDEDGRLRLVITTRTSQSPTPSSITHFYQRR